MFNIFMMSPSEIAASSGERRETAKIIFGSVLHAEYDPFPYTPLQFIVPAVLAVFAYTGPLTTIGTVKSKTGEFRSPVNARCSHRTHKRRYCTRLHYSVVTFLVSRFPRRLARVHKTSVCRTVRPCARPCCVWRTRIYIYSRTYPRRRTRGNASRL